MRSIKQYLAAATCLSMALALGACSSSGDDVAANKPRLALTVTPSVGQAAYTSLPVALKYWEEEGLDVEINMLEGSSAGIQSVEAGQSDVVIGGTGSMMAADASGANLQMFYTIITSNFQDPVVLEDSSISEIGQLEGKKVGVSSLESGGVPAIKGLIAQSGGDPDKVEFITVGLGSEAAASLTKNRVDALALGDDAHALIKALDVPVRKVSSDAGDNLGFQLGIQARRDWIKENPEIAAAFARGVAKATAFTEANPEAAVRLHWDAYPETKPTGMSDADAMKQALLLVDTRAAVSVPVEGVYGLATDEQVTDYRDFLVDAGALTEPIDVDDIWTSELLDDINDFDLKAVQKEAKNFKK